MTRVSAVVSSGRPLIRYGIEAILATDPARVHVLDVGSRAGVAADVLIFDATDIQGAHGTKRLSRLTAAGRTPVIAIAPPARQDLTSLALQIGAAAATTHDVSTDELIDLVVAVGQGLELLVLMPGSVEVSPQGLGAGLSPREEEIMRLICKGLANQEISAELFLGMNTIKTYIRTAYRKIGVTSRSQAVLWAIGHGLAWQSPIPIPDEPSVSV